MNTAPVGFQCPECVRAGTATVRQPTTPLGGKRREQGDLVTKVLIGINVVVWLIGLIVGSERLLEALALANIVRIEPGAPLVGVLVGDWYRMLTAAFVHEQIWHIALNMLALWILGSSLEPILGRWRFIALYLVSALGGSVVSLLGLPPGGIAFGASGAVFGLFGALFVVARRFGRDVTSVLVILGINAVIGFTVPGIDWRAHLGGLITGAVLAFAFAHAPKTHRTMFSVAACSVVVAAIVLVAALFVA
ncbi:MAG TPA: rhomboid family intramembrane serine protease [Jiangellaceae bacterium]|nr:rhomboid family intramembrane serine protease [Jiangellaceae bacterium]